MHLMFTVMHSCPCSSFCVSTPICVVSLIAPSLFIKDVAHYLHFQIIISTQMEYSYSYYQWYWDRHFCLWEFQTHYSPLHLGGTFTLLIWDIEHFHSFQILKCFYFLLRLYWYCTCSIMLDIPLDWVSMHLG